MVGDNIICSMTKIKKGKLLTKRIKISRLFFPFLNLFGFFRHTHTFANVSFFWKYFFTTRVKFTWSSHHLPPPLPHLFLFSLAKRFWKKIFPGVFLLHDFSLPPSPPLFPLFPPTLLLPNRKTYRKSQKKRENSNGKLSTTKFSMSFFYLLKRFYVNFLIKLMDCINTNEKLLLLLS